MPLPPEIESDIEAILAEFGDPITWKGDSYQALVSDVGMGAVPGLGGFIDSGEISVKLLRSHLTAGVPALGDSIGFDGADFRVTRVSDRPSRPVIILTCAAKDE